MSSRLGFWLSTCGTMRRLIRLVIICFQCGDAKLLPTFLLDPGICGSNPSSTEMPLFVELDEYPLPVVFPTEPLYPHGVPQALLSASTSSQSFVEGTAFIVLDRCEPAPNETVAKSRTATPKEEAKINWILSRDSLCPLKPEEKQLLWEHRYELLSKPKSLPKFLLSVAYEDRYQVQEMHHLLGTYLSFSVLRSTLIIPFQPSGLTSPTPSMHWSCWTPNLQMPL